MNLPPHRYARLCIVDRLSATGSSLPVATVPTIEIDDVDEINNNFQNKSLGIKINLRDEPWGDHYFSIEDPTTLNRE
jgi:uncharacterized glyoxalase superfamily protein PhnB